MARGRTIGAGGCEVRAFLEEWMLPDPILDSTRVTHPHVHRAATMRMNLAPSRASLTRPQIVWTALAAAMTLVGGMLWALEGGRGRSFDGVALSPMLGVTRTTSIGAIFSTRAPLARERWDTIVIHHSGRTTGTPSDLEAQHLRQDLDGLAFHFVIGNGRGTGDGELFVARRWLDQVPGAHVAGERGDELNRRSIGICLIGDGTTRPFTDAQMRRLVQLAAALAESLGIPEERIVLHSDVAPVRDPGLFFSEAEFREQLARLR